MKKVKPEEVVTKSKEKRVAVMKEGQKKTVKPDNQQKNAEKAVKEKKPKVELVTYTIRATIPTGAYSNICPEVTVKAESLEVAERAVMPHIERLFAKYRDGSGQSKEIREEVVQPVYPPLAPVNTPVQNNPTNIVQSTPIGSVPLTSEAPKPILAAPYQKAQQAVNSCTSLEALTLIRAQVEKSEKLVDGEKSNLRSLIAAKEYSLM